MEMRQEEGGEREGRKTDWATEGGTGHSAGRGSSDAV